MALTQKQMSPMHRVDWLWWVGRLTPRTFWGEGSNTPHLAFLYSPWGGGEIVMKEILAKRSGNIGRVVGKDGFVPPLLTTGKAESK